MKQNPEAALDLPSGHLTSWSVFSKVYRHCLPILCLVAALCYIDRSVNATVITSMGLPAALVVTWDDKAQKVSAWLLSCRTNLAYASFSMTKDLSFSPSVYGTGKSLDWTGDQTSQRGLLLSR